MSLVRCTRSEEGWRPAHTRPVHAHSASVLRPSLSAGVGYSGQCSVCFPTPQWHMWSYPQGATEPRLLAEPHPRAKHSVFLHGLALPRCLSSQFIYSFQKYCRAPPVCIWDIEMHAIGPALQALSVNKEKKDRSTDNYNTVMHVMLCERKYLMCTGF